MDRSGIEGGHVHHEGSDFDTLLAVYTGSTLEGLVVQAANDDTTGTTSSVDVNVTAGTTYRVAVDSYNGVTGTVQRQWDIGSA